VSEHQMMLNVQGGPKNVSICFCQNVVKSPSKLLFFGALMAKINILC